jgi:hypothetical protein
MRLEGLGQFKNPMTSSGIKPATFRESHITANQFRIFCASISYKKMEEFTIYKLIPKS